MVIAAGWKKDYHFREEVTFNTFTDGRIIVHKSHTSRGKERGQIIYSTTSQIFQ